MTNFDPVIMYSSGGWWWYNAAVGLTDTRTGTIVKSSCPTYGPFPIEAIARKDLEFFRLEHCSKE